jgi:cellulose synthase/poly-beta-1,6-N-acetylglucosamine synthase-like glycosyltransferase
MLVLLCGSLAALLYIYAGYPLLLRLFVAVRGSRSVRREPILPRVSLVISAYNEGAVIRRKVLNALALDYPADRLQIAVVSDASSDSTDDIVREFAGRVDLLRQPERRGKTAGLNRFVPGLSGDVIVFSDANAMYEPQAIRMLVRNLADPEVGCVTGEARYLKEDRSTAGISERVYWDYEIRIKRLETELGSMVGGDGAIYAIRRELWRELPENAINDFLNPLDIVARGYRAVYERDAICHEETAGGLRREWKRRIRIVSRSWRAVFQASGVLNPFRAGLFTFSLLSHKVLRWFSGVFLAGAAIAGVALTARLENGLLLLALAAISAAVAAISHNGRRLLAFASYFIAINAASLVGILRGTLGSVSGVWTTPRGEERPRETLVRPGLAILTLAGGGTTLAIAFLFAGGQSAAFAVFWACLGMLAYVYFGYPLLLRASAALFARPVVVSAIHPRVCLLIAANDEAEVIAEKLDNALAIDYPRDRLEIVVASDGSRDATNAIVRSYAERGVRLLAFPERRGKISAINDGMKTVASEIVVLSDANTFLRPDAVRQLVRNFADGSVGAVSGDVMLTGERAALAGSEDLYYRYERALQRLESEVGSLIGVDGALYAMRRELFVAPQSDTILDDMAIPMAVLRSGRRVVFEPAALADEAGSSSASEEFSRKVRVVAGAVQFLMRRDSAVRLKDVQVLFALMSHKALRWMSPAFAAFVFVTSAMLASDSRYFALVLGGECALLLAGVAGCVPFLRRVNIVALAHYICLVQTAAAVGFLKGVTGRQAVAWRRFARAPMRGEVSGV